MSKYACDNCEWTGKDNELHDIERLLERVSEGELMPAGQCPICKSLVGCSDESMHIGTLAAVAKVMRKQGWTIREPVTPKKMAKERREDAA